MKKYIRIAIVDLMILGSILGFVIVFLNDVNGDREAIHNNGWLFVLRSLQDHGFAKVNQFNLENYRWAINEFPSDKKVDQINNVNDAVEAAKKLWAETFGNDDINFYLNRPIEIYYDMNNECWHICGTLPDDMLGGVPHILIRKTGEVLAIWGDM